MLAPRLFPRPVATIMRGSQIQRRFIHPSRFQLQVPLPPPNKAKSILVALEKIMRFGALILCSWIIYGALKAELKTLIDSEEAEDKAKMIYIQQMDITYDSVNFDDPLSTLSYFAKLCQPFTPHSEEEFNQQFKILMMQIIKMGTKDDSIISAEFQALHIMRSTAEKIHSVFRELNREADASTAELVTLVVTEALASLIYLARDDDPSPNWVILSG